MKKCCIMLLLFFAVAAYAQKTKTVKAQGRLRRVTDYFTVLKANPDIRQGHYTQKDDLGHVLTTGFYKDNVKDSVWKEYDRNDKVVAAGLYRNNVKAGVWNYYNPNGDIANIYDHTLDTLLFHRPGKSDSVTHYVIVGKDTTQTLLDRAPVYLSGDAVMYRALLLGLRYPMRAVANHIAGRVIIGFTVDETGNTRDYKVLKSVGHGLDEEALACVKSIPPDWLPGILNGKPVATVIIVPVKFN